MKLNSGIVRLRISDRKLVILTTRVLPGFFIKASNWLLHMAVLSCAVIGWVDLVKPYLRFRWIPDTQNKPGGDHGRSVEISIWSGEKQFKLAGNLSELQESVKVFLGNNIFVTLPTVPVSENLSPLPGDCHGYCSF